MSAEAAGVPAPEAAGPRASRYRNAAATATQAATDTQNMNLASGSMKLSPATLPKDSVATLYMPSGKTTLHSPVS